MLRDPPDPHKVCQVISAEFFDQHNCCDDTQDISAAESWSIIGAWNKSGSHKTVCRFVQSRVQNFQLFAQHFQIFPHLWKHPRPKTQWLGIGSSRHNLSNRSNTLTRNYLLMLSFHIFILGISNVDSTDDESNMNHVILRLYNLHLIILISARLWIKAP